MLVLFLLLNGAIIVYGDVWDPWHTKSEHISRMKSLCDSHSEASYVSIGKSEQEKDIWMFKIGWEGGGVVMWDGQLHGNEDFGSEIIYLMTEWLLESGDERAERILERNLILFVSVVNTDSYGRYNSRDVNLNRNFVTGWSSSAENPGPSPASEAETQVMRSIFQEYKPDFYVNLHQGTGPWFKYYRDSDRTLANEVLSRAEEIADNELSYLHNSQWNGSLMSPGSLGGSTPGYAIGDAYTVACASSWLCEVDESWRHDSATWSELENRMYPQCLAMFIAMAESARAMEGDVNHDAKVDILDVIKVTSIYASQVGDENWNCHADIADPYGVIDILDVVTVTANYGKKWSDC